MYKRILFILAIFIGVGLLLGYGREALAIRSQVNGTETADFDSQGSGTVISETLKFLPPEDAALAEGRYGRSVLVEADTFFVGQSPSTIDPNTFTPGQLFVYDRHTGGPNNWGLTEVVTPSDSTPGDGEQFGTALAISGDTLIVGAVVGDGNANESGTAYIFERNEGGPDNWGEVAKLQASDGAYEDRFGWTVDIDGDTAVVGARWDDNSNGFEAGAIYIFERDAGGPNNWGQVRKVITSDGDPTDRFGLAVAVSGDVIVAGADGQDTNGFDSGSVYIFERNAGGPDNWGEVAQIYPDQPAANDQFGLSLNIEGNMVAAGAIQTSPNPGAVYLFDRDEGGTNNWGQLAHLAPSDGVAGDRFGFALELEAGRLIIGAQFGDGVAANSGTAYLFEQDGANPNQWLESYKLIASDGAANDEFGRGVTISGETMAAGAFFNDDLCPSDSGCDSGSAYLFTAVLSSDLTINKVASDDTAVPGQPITYTLAFTNNGLDIAFASLISDVVPAMIISPTFTNSGATITQTGNTPFAWEVADLAPGEGGIITVTGIVSPNLISETTIMNTAVITNNLDATPTNNSSTAVTQIIIPEINLAASDYVVAEDGGVVTITAVLSPAQPYLDVTVTYQSVEGTAVAGEDYTAVSGILTFTAGMTQVNVSIPILNDQLVESAETFSFALSNPFHAVLGNLPTATVTIADDDVLPAISLSAAAYTVSEAVGEATITVTLDRPYPQPVTVSYETQNGTAVAGEDYTATSGSLTLTVGLTQTTFTVAITDDLAVELAETLTISLTEFTNVNPQPPLTATLTLFDNDEEPPPTDMAYVYLPIIMRPAPKPPATFPIHIGDGVAVRPATVQGEVFYTTTIQIPASLPTTGQFFLSSLSTHIGPIVVDDELAIILNGEEVFVKQFFFDGQTTHPEIIELPRQTLEPMAGQTVTVIFRDVFSALVSASEIWLIHVP